MLFKGKELPDELLQRGALIKGTPYVDESWEVLTRYMQLSAKSAESLAIIHNDIAFTNEDSHNFNFIYGNCMPVLNRTAKDVCKAVEKAVESLSPDYSIMSDTFYLNRELKMDKRFLHINSPIVKTSKSWDEYLLTLTKKRRYKLKKAYEESQAYEIIMGPVLKKEYVHWCEKHFEKYEDAAEAAMLGVFWTMACEAANASHYVMIYHENEIKAIGGFISKWINDEHNWVFNIFISDGTIPNIGAMLLAWTIKEGIENKWFDVLDPTCKSRPEENTIDVYKRIGVNTERYLPVFAGMTNDEELEGLYPPYYLKNEGWSIPNETQTMYEGI